MEGPGGSRNRARKAIVKAHVGNKSRNIEKAVEWGSDVSLALGLGDTGAWQEGLFLKYQKNFTKPRLPLK